MAPSVKYAVVKRGLLYSVLQGVLDLPNSFVNGADPPLTAGERVLRTVQVRTEWLLGKVLRNPFSPLSVGRIAANQRNTLII